MSVRQGNTEHSHTKFRETTGDGRSFDRVKEVGGAAKPAPASRVQAARVAHHGPNANPNGPRIGTDETPRVGNQPHTPEYAGPGQCESSGSRVGNTPHTSQDINASPQRHTVGGKVEKTSKERFSVRKNGQQN